MAGTKPKRFPIERGALDNLDDEILVQDLAVPIGDETHPPPKDQVWDIYSANAHLTRAQVTIGALGDAIAEVLNGGLFQLIMNPAGGLIPDLPAVFRELGREEEAKTFERVQAMFPGADMVRDYQARTTFAGTQIVPGGWDGLLAESKTELYQELETLEQPLADFMQSEPFFRAVAKFIEAHPESFEIVDD